MVTRIADSMLIDLKAADALKKFGKLKLVPSLAVSATAAGGPFVALRVAWGTLLVPGTLSVVIRRGDPTDPDVVSRLVIDDDAMCATGTVDVGGVGSLVVAASGEFLARLAPMRTVRLASTASAYLPS